MILNRPDPTKLRLGAYDAFISYSHALDDKLAPKLHRALEFYGKSLFTIRAIRVFRDETNLRGCLQMTEADEAHGHTQNGFVHEGGALVQPRLRSVGKIDYDPAAANPCPQTAWTD